MNAPIWIASPPEVHSLLLASGPGSGPLLAAASMWHHLSLEYLDIAQELTDLLTQVRTTQWAGIASDQYVQAYVPYLAWLEQMSVNSTQVATMHETSAIAYDTALATMPTLAELAANHATHAALLATNFFGINTVLIALNEADYARMWVQAASVMESYHLTATALLESLPHIEPAPPIIKVHSLPTHSTPQPFTLHTFIEHLLQHMRSIFQDPMKLFHHHATGMHGASSISSTALLVAVQQAYSISTKMTFWTLVFSLGSSLPIAIALRMTPEEIPDTVEAPQQSTPERPLDLPQPIVVIPQPSVALPSATTPAPPAPTPVTPATVLPVGFAYKQTQWIPALTPGGGVGPTQSDRDNLKAPAMGVRRSTSASRRTQRRGRQDRNSHSYEFADMDAETIQASSSSTAQSQHGSGILGFTGTTIRNPDVTGAGLTTLYDEHFGGEISQPMLPETWRNCSDNDEQSLDKTTAPLQAGQRS